MKYTKLQYILTGLVGSLIAWQGVPKELKASIPHLSVVEVVTTVALGGLYAIEKLMQIPVATVQQIVNRQQEEDQKHG